MDLRIARFCVVMASSLLIASCASLAKTPVTVEPVPAAETVPSPPEETPTPAAEVIREPSEQDVLSPPAERLTESPPSTAAPIAAIPEPPKPEPTALEKAELMLSEGDNDGAEAVLAAYADENPESAGAQLVYASVLLSDGKTNEAARILEAALVRSPANPDLLYTASMIEAAKGNTARRGDLLKQAVAADPKHSDSLAALGSMALDRKDYKVARGYFERSLAANPRNSEAYVGLASVFYGNGMPGEAEKTLDLVLSLAASPQAYADRAKIRSERGNAAGALEDIDEAIALEPDYYWNYIQKAKIVLKGERKLEALPALDRAIALDPEYFLAYVYRAGIFEEYGRDDEAIADYKVVCKSYPEYYFAFESLGMLSFKHGAWADARSAFTVAFMTASRDYSYPLLVAASYLKELKFDQAKAYLAQVIKKVDREQNSLYWELMKFLIDQGTDSYVLTQITKEKKQDLKSAAIFYMAVYYEAKGLSSLAESYYAEVKGMQRIGTLEYQMNEWRIARTAGG